MIQQFCNPNGDGAWTFICRSSARRHQPRHCLQRRQLRLRLRHPLLRLRPRRRRLQGDWERGEPAPAEPVLRPGALAPDARLAPEQGTVGIPATLDAVALHAPQAGVGHGTREPLKEKV